MFGGHFFWFSYYILGFLFCLFLLNIARLGFLGRFFGFCGVGGLKGGFVLSYGWNKGVFEGLVFIRPNSRY